MKNSLHALIAFMAFAVPITSFAQGRERTVDKTTVSDRNTTLGVFYALEPNCKPLDWVEVRIVGGPKHGKAAVTDRNVAVAYAKNNPRRICNGRSVAAKGVSYTSNKDYKGSDNVSIELINSKGAAQRIKYQIVVK